MACCANVNIKIGFTLQDIKSGYIVKFRNGTLHKVVEIGKRGSLIILDYEDNNWEYLSSWNHDMTASVYMAHEPFIKTSRDKVRELDITEVYGYVEDTKYYRYANDISILGRPLLWSRTPIKKMTVSEIEKELGYKIEIVSEEAK